MASQLDDTTAELQELKLRQRQLEARAHLLETLAALNKQQLPPDTLQSTVQVQAAC